MGTASMNKNTINLERLNTDSNMDDDAVLADMKALANEAGDWRDHLPFEAALHFQDDSKVREACKIHVDSCKYCQRLINILHSS